MKKKRPLLSLFFLSLFSLALSLFSLALFPFSLASSLPTSA